MAADTAHDQPGKIILVTPEGNEAGTLEYDFERAELYLDITGALPKWHTLDVEIQTNDGNKFQETTTRETGTKLVLSRERHVKRDKVESVTIRPRQG